MRCEGGVIVSATGLNDRRVAGSFHATHLGIQRLSLAPFDALTAACECASLSKGGSSQSVRPNAGRM